MRKSGQREQHGYSYTKLHGVWRDMLARCLAPKNRNYPSYGGRGIGVCERWQNSFLAFKEDMGSQPDGTSLDRIDNDGDYEPTNCRWATPTEQIANRRNSRLLSYAGKTMTIGAWEKHLGLSKGTLWLRIERGVPVPEALKRIER